MSDKIILLEVLDTYKCLPCLWDTSDKDYMNREARQAAYQILLDKYKKFDSLANMDAMKKKIENMRTSYKRELRKMMNSQLAGEDPPYQPSLWYFKHLLFLDNKDECDFSFVLKNSFSSCDEDAAEESTAFEDVDTNANDKHDYGATNSSKRLIYSPPRLKPKTKRSKKSDTVFIVQNEEEPYQSQPDVLESFDSSNEVEAFGRTIGLQLKGLSDMQRHIAEKLMSDIIFHGRLNQLNHKTNINLNEDFN